MELDGCQIFASFRMRCSKVDDDEEMASQTGKFYEWTSGVGLLQLDPALVQHLHEAYDNFISDSSWRFRQRGPNFQEHLVGGLFLCLAEYDRISVT